MDRYQLSRLRPKRSWVTLMQITIIGLIVIRSQLSRVDDLFVIFGIAFSIFRSALYRETPVT